MERLCSSGLQGPSLCTFTIRQLHARGTWGSVVGGHQVHIWLMLSVSELRSGSQGALRTENNFCWQAAHCIPVLIAVPQGIL